MTASKAKPVGRAVNVRKHCTETGSLVVSGYTGSAKTLKRLAEIAAMDEQMLLKQVAKTMHRAKVEADRDYNCGMDEEGFEECWNIISFEQEKEYAHQARSVLKALGLSAAQARRKGRKK